MRQDASHPDDDRPGVNHVVNHVISCRQSCYIVLYRVVMPLGITTWPPPCRLLGDRHAMLVAYTVTPSGGLYRVPGTF